MQIFPPVSLSLEIWLWVCPFHYNKLRLGHMCLVVLELPLGPYPCHDPDSQQISSLVELES